MFHRSITCDGYIKCIVQLWERFRAGQKPPESLGASRDFNVDMVPKFIMANGNLVKVLLCCCDQPQRVCQNDVVTISSKPAAHAAAALARKLDVTHPAAASLPSSLRAGAGEDRRDEVSGVQGGGRQLRGGQRQGGEGARKCHGGAQIAAHGVL